MVLSVSRAGRKPRMSEQRALGRAGQGHVIHGAAGPPGSHHLAPRALDAQLRSGGGYWVPH